MKILFIILVIFIFCACRVAYTSYSSRPIVVTV